jgi:hypothetical protein
LALLAVATAAGALGPGYRWAPAQEAGGAAVTRDAAVALSPDSVRVGEPFVLGISVRWPEGEVVFPGLLDLDEELEQLEPVALAHDGEGRETWRAYYRLVAWQAGTIPIPEIAVDRSGESLVVRPPPINVISVLPADPPEPLRLRPPRPPEERRPFPWWLLLLLAALLLAAWLLRRMRKEDEAAEADVLTVHPAVSAREALVRLRAEVQGGRLAPEAFYDGLEEVVRTYLHARRGWPPTRPVRELSGARELLVSGDGREADAQLIHIQARAGLVRFAGVEGAREAAVADADSCLEWLEISEATLEAVA